MWEWTRQQTWGAHPLPRQNSPEHSSPCGDWAVCILPTFIPRSCTNWRISWFLHSPPCRLKTATSVSGLKEPGVSSFVVWEVPWTDLDSGYLVAGHTYQEENMTMNPMAGLLECNVSSLRRRDNIFYFYHSGGSAQVCHPSIPWQRTSVYCYPSKKRSHFSLNSHNSPNRDVNHSGMSGTRIETFVGLLRKPILSPPISSPVSKGAGMLPGFNLHLSVVMHEYRRSVMWRNTLGSIPQTSPAAGIGVRRQSGL